MEFRRRHNMYFATLYAYATYDPVGVVTATDIEVTSWLGIAERELIRQLPAPSPVLLDITSWRRMILDPYVRLSPGIFMVGARIEAGVVGVMDRGQPMVRLVQNGRDRLA